MLSRFPFLPSYTLESLRAHWQPSGALLPFNSVWIRQCRDEASLLSGVSNASLLEKGIIYRLNHASCQTPQTSFAYAFEAIRRVLGMELYDVQLQAGYAIFQGSIAQVQTGEGKTLVAGLAAIGHALAGRTTHVMTVNSYLAERDFRLLTPAFQLLGLKVGWTDPSLSPIEKRQAYQCEVMYGPGYEFGFDYLRDRISEMEIAHRPSGDQIRQRLRGNASANAKRIQGSLDVAIVDEADSVMLDEANSPLLVSGGGRKPANNAVVYREAARTAKGLTHNLDFIIRNDVFEWTQAGLNLVANPPKTVANGLHRSWPAYVQQALRATHQLHRDVHYVLADGQIQIVDQQTGRIFAERTWSDGLQQAVEAKEDLLITAEQDALARITRQRYLRLYSCLSGLTGTAEGSERELKDIYRLRLSVIPTHRPSQRQILAPRLFHDRKTLEHAIVDDVLQRQDRGQPVLIGTTSIRSTEMLATLFSKIGLVHQSLTGRQDTDEASIVAQAGQRGAVTIATNMAGRGTDIQIDSAIKQLGGLHVIVTELNESARVERQLIGRAARQGDPGSSQLFISAEDSLLLRYAPELARRVFLTSQTHLQSEVDQCIELIRRLQKQLEARRTSERRQMYAHDDWLESVMREIG